MKRHLGAASKAIWILICLGIIALTVIAWVNDSPTIAFIATVLLLFTLWSIISQFISDWDIVDRTVERYANNRKDRLFEQKAGEIRKTFDS